MKKLCIATALVSLLALSFALAGEQECERELMNARSNLGMRNTDQSFSSISGNSGDIESLNINRFFRVKKQLILTPEQINSLDELRLDLKKDMLDKYNEIRKTRTELNALLRNVVPDFPSVQEKIETISSLQLQIKSETIDAYEQAYNLLTPGQKTKFAEALSNKPRPQPNPPPKQPSTK